MNLPGAFRETLLAHLPYADGDDFEAGDDLAALGLDSMGVVQLLNDLEETFAVELPDELITEETFETVGSLWAALGGYLQPERYADV